MAYTNATNDIWTDGRVSILKRMLSAGATYGEIASELGAVLTRNACIGKATRLGLRGKSSRDQKRIPVPSAKGNYSSDGAVAGGILSRIKSKMNSDRAPVVALKVVYDAAEQEPLHISFEQLTRTSCRWPYGDVSPFTFCGCQALPTKPFCAARAKRAVQKPISEVERDRRQAHGKTIAAIGRKVSKSRRAFA